MINTAVGVAVPTLKVSFQGETGILLAFYVKPTVCFKLMLSICLIIHLPMNFFSCDVLNSEIAIRATFPSLSK